MCIITKRPAETEAGDERMVEWTLMGLSLLVAVNIALLVYLFEAAAIATQAEHAVGFPYRWSLNKYFVDEFYNKYFPIGATLFRERPSGRCGWD